MKLEGGFMRHIALTQGYNGSAKSQGYKHSDLKELYLLLSTWVFKVSSGKHSIATDNSGLISCVGDS